MTKRSETPATVKNLLEEIERQSKRLNQNRAMSGRAEMVEDLMSNDAEVSRLFKDIVKNPNHKAELIRCLGAAKLVHKLSLEQISQIFWVDSEILAEIENEIEEEGRRLLDSARVFFSGSKQAVKLAKKDATAFEPTSFEEDGKVGVSFKINASTKDMLEIVSAAADESNTVVLQEMIDNLSCAYLRGKIHNIPSEKVEHKNTATRIYEVLKFRHKHRAHFISPAGESDNALSAEGPKYNPFEMAEGNFFKSWESATSYVHGVYQGSLEGMSIYSGMSHDLAVILNDMAKSEKTFEKLDGFRKRYLAARTNTSNKLEQHLKPNDQPDTQ